MMSCACISPANVAIPLTTIPFCTFNAANSLNTAVIVVVKPTGGGVSENPFGSKKGK